MPRQIRLSALAALALVAMWSANTGLRQAAADSVLIDRDGVWSFERLGYGDAEARPEKGRSWDRFQPLVVRYRLPPHASQGNPNWYIVHLNVEIKVQEESGTGLAYVIGSTNGYAAVLVKLEVEKTATGLVVRGSDYGLVDGFRATSGGATLIRQRFSNYLQDRGVRPGLNELDVAVKEFGEARLERLTVLRDSAIEVTAAAPASLSLSLSDPEEVEVGRPFRLKYRVENSGGRPAQGVKVEVKTSGPLGVIGPSQVGLGMVEREVEGEVMLLLREEGAASVSLVVTSTTDRAVGSADIVVARGRGWLFALAPGVLLATGGILVAAYLIGAVRHPGRVP